VLDVWPHRQAFLAVNSAFRRMAIGSREKAGLEPMVPVERFGTIETALNQPTPVLPARTVLLVGTLNER
jgi:hypothetical protein